MLNSFLRDKKRLLIIVLLIGILVFGSWLRILNTQYAKNVDEPNVNKRAAQIASGEYHINWYNWPGQSLMRLNAVPYKIQTTYLNRHSDIKHTAIEWYRLQPETYNTLSHIISAFFSIITIFLVFLLGRELKNAWSGLIAALFFSVSYLSILHAHFGTPDSPMAAVFVGVVLCSVYLRRAIDKKNIRQIWMYAIANGLLIGFGVATKYTAAVAAVPLLVVVIEHVISSSNKKESIWQGSKIIAVAFAATFICHLFWNPFFIVDAKSVYQDIVIEAEGARLGVDWGGKHFVFFRNAFYYLAQVFSWNGSVIGLIGYGTLLSVFFMRNTEEKKNMRLVVIFYVSILLFLSVLKLHWSRWGVPFTPFIAVAAGVGVVHLHDALQRIISSKHIRTVLILCLISIAIFPQVTWSYVKVSTLAYPNTSLVMSRFVRETLPSDSKVYSDFYYMNTEGGWHIFEKRLPLYNKTVAQHQAEGVDYVIIRPEIYNGAIAQPDLYPNILEYITTLQKEKQSLKRVTGDCSESGKTMNDIEFYRWLYTNGFGAIQQTCIIGPTLELYSIK